MRACEQGLKIERSDNLKLAFDCCANSDGVLDTWSFAKIMEADYERVPQQHLVAGSEDTSDKKKPTTAAKPPHTASSVKEKKQIGASTVVEVKPFG